MMSYDQLKEELAKVPWIKRSKEIAVGSLVMVKERKTATVKAVRADKVQVLFDAPPRMKSRPGPPNAKDLSRSQELLQDVVADDVSVRPKMYDIPSGLVPDAIQSQVARFRLKLDSLKDGLVPVLQDVSDVITWKHSKIRLARMITVGAFVASVLLFLFHEWYRLCGNTTMVMSRPQMWIKATLKIRCGSRKTWAEYESWCYIFHLMLAFVIDHGGMTIVMVSGIFVLLTQAGWLVPFKALCRMLNGKLCKKRTAPKQWAFFRKSHLDAARDTQRSTETSVPSVD